MKLGDVRKVDAIFKGIDPQGIQYTQIEGYDYSNLDSIKKELKVKALLAAKDKAAYLAASIDKELGDALEVSEFAANPSPDRYAHGPVLMEQTAQAAGSAVDFKTLKVNYQMRAVFRMH